MKNLLLKDIKVQKSIFFVYCFWLIITNIILLLEYSGGGEDIKSLELNLMMFLIMGIVFFPIASINYIVAKTRGKSGSINMLLRSLPVTLKDIVISKTIIPIVIFMIYLVPNVILQIIISNYLGIGNTISIGAIAIIFIIFYVLAVLNFYIELLYPKSTMLYYVRTVPMFILIFGITVLKRFFVTNAELTFILENLNVVLILLGLVVIVVSILSSRIVLKKFKSIEL